VRKTGNKREKRGERERCKNEAINTAGIHKPLYSKRKIEREREGCGGYDILSAVCHAKDCQSYVN
jgi:hypothetical protein